MPAAAPSVPFVNSLASWAWLGRTASGPVAFLLLAHPEADNGTVQPQLTGLAFALGLVRPTRRLPDVGRRVAIVGGRQAAVRLDGCGHMIQVDVGRAWAEFVSSGGSIALLVGLRPLPRRAPRGQVETYLAAGSTRSHIRLGLARSVGTFTESEVRPRTPPGDDTWTGDPWNAGPWPEDTWPDPYATSAPRDRDPRDGWLYS